MRTINVPPKIKYTSITNSKLREEQYFNCIIEIIKSRCFKKIVFCENSMYNGDYIVAIQEFANKNGIMFEYLTFKSDIENVQKLGKGFGEGEILKYAMLNSKLLNDDTIFFKVTGRLIIDNLAEIIKKQRLEEDCIFINRFFKISSRYVDTRAYFMPIKIFKKYFIEAFCECDDDKGMYLERVYYKTIKINKLKQKNTVLAFDYNGLSGSSGASYRITRKRLLIYNLLHKINFFYV